jgi:hypothetical protein
VNYSELVTAVQDYLETTFTTADINTMIRQAEQRIFNSVQLASLRKNVVGSCTANNKYLQCPDDFLSVYSMAVYPPNGGDYLYLLNKDVNFIREAYPNPTSTGKPEYYAIFGPSSVTPTELVFILGPTPDLAYNVELHYYYYPTSIVQRSIASVEITNPGFYYVNGTYFDVPLSNVTGDAGVSGETARATITVTNNEVSNVVITNPGCYYVQNALLTVNNSYLGNDGTDLEIRVLTVNNAQGTSWLGDNFDSVLLYGTLMEASTFLKAEPDQLANIQGRYKESLMLVKRLGDGLERMDSYRSGQVRDKVV